MESREHLAFAEGERVAIAYIATRSTLPANRALKSVRGDAGSSRS
jgi:hypothetical protein